MSYKNLHDIKARVTARWKHPNCKFQRDDYAEVAAQVLPREWVHQDECGNRRIKAGTSYVSKVKQARAGQVGKVIAVSCLPSGRIRSNDWGRDGQPTRMFTRYYIQFRDHTIMGFESHHLKKAFGCK
jgi:hypothetical protein